MTLEDLLRRAEIERKLKPSAVGAYTLRGGISNYEVLFSPLSTMQKARSLGVSRATVQRQLIALKSNGLTDPEEVRKYKEKFNL